MIAQVVIAAALSVWAPANNGRPPCDPGATRPALVAQAPNDVPAGHPAWAIVGGGCDAVGYTADLETEPASVQCAVMAHEYGHAAMGLEHSDDPASLMNGDTLNIPAVCIKLDARAVRRDHPHWFDVMPGRGRRLVVAGGTR